jgi:NitT/TauT family transport system permease protein
MSESIASSTLLATSTVQRPDFVREPTPLPIEISVQRRLSKWVMLTNNHGLRHALIILVLIIAWQVYGTLANNDLIFPTFTETAASFWTNLVNGPLLARAAVSLDMLAKAYGIGVALALALVALAASSKMGADLLATLTAMFNPLPAIALLPLALLWFGLGQGAIIFVVVHSVLWAVALNAHAGFQSVSETTRMAGRNMGLRGPRYILLLLIPAALPAILSGLRIGWAFAWRTLIAAELVFGTTSGSGGIGWFIFENRNMMDTPAVFAGLAAVVLIGLAVEGAIFRVIENHTVRTWGMQR